MMNGIDIEKAITGLKDGTLIATPSDYLQQLQAELQTANEENGRLREANKHYLEVCTENQQLQAELEKHRWIPVSERLPEEPGDYGVTDGEIWWQTCWKNKDIEPDGWWQRYSRTITHWKPIVLPEDSGAKPE